MGRGKLNVLIGPMKSRKTTTAILNATELAEVNERKVLYITSNLDIRDVPGGDGNFTSHNPILNTMSKKIDKQRVKDLIDVVNYHNYQEIFIDEANFYSDLIPHVELWIQNGINVHAIGLSGGFDLKPFGNFLLLIPMADNIIPFKAQCDVCITNYKNKIMSSSDEDNFDLTNIFEASFTRRIVPCTDSLLVGGKDKYQTVCRNHWSLPSSIDNINKSD